MERFRARPRTLSRRRALAGLAGAGVGLLGAPVWAQKKLALAAAPAKRPPAGKLLLMGAKLWLAGEAPADESWLLFDDGKLVDRGTGKSTPSGPKLKVLDVGGKLTTLGFVDLVTQVGLVEVDLEDSSASNEEETEESVRAAFRAADGYNPSSPVVPIARTGGITSVGVVPSSGLVPGQSCWVDLDGTIHEPGVVKAPLGLHVQIDSQWGPPTNHGTALLELRELLDDTQSFVKNPAGYERRGVRELGTSRLDLLATSQILGGKLPVFFHVDKAITIRRLLTLSEKYKLNPVFVSANEGWRVARELSKAKAPVVINPLDNAPRSFSALAAGEHNARVLLRAGVKVSFTYGGAHNARKLRQVAGNAIRAGVTRDQALAAVTTAPASIAGLADRYSSLKKGSTPNLVVWSGDPFELSSKAQLVLIGGRRTSLKTRQTELFERYR